jgi:hypothetical protein
MTPTIDAKPVKEEKGQPHDYEKKKRVGRSFTTALSEAFASHVVADFGEERGDYPSD